MTNDDQFAYDVALSFAGEDRAIVEKFAKLLEAKNVKFFYDDAEVPDLWGKNLIDHLADVYEKQARYCIMFISKHYPLKKWTNFERTHIQARAFQDPNEYILPIKLDDTEIIGLPATIGYRDIRKHSLESIVNALAQKLAKSKGQTGSSSTIDDIQPMNVQATNSTFGTIPMPKRKKTFTQLEKDRFAKESYNYVKQYFQQALRQLETHYSDTQTEFDDITNFKFTSKIYVQGDIKAQSSVWLGNSIIPNTIYYNEGAHRLNDDAINDYLPVEDNGEEMYLHIGNFGFSMIRVEETNATQQEAAEYLWKRFTSHLEYR